MKKQNPSFQEAMNAASIWCNAWEEGELSDEVLADRIAELLSTKNGTRGFFVISLSSDSPLMDRLPETLIFQLREAGENIVDITTKNFAMSTAMSIHHKKNRNLQQQSRSKKIQRRCIEILRVLDTHSVRESLESLFKATKGKGKYVNFVNRCNFDDEQKKEIASEINYIAEN